VLLPITNQFTSAHYTLNTMQLTQDIARRFKKLKDKLTPHQIDRTRCYPTRHTSTRQDAASAIWPDV